MAMKKVLAVILALPFMGFAMAGSELGKGFYFPECQVHLSGPVSWYGYNETQGEAGIVYVTREKMIGAESKFLAGVTVYTNMEAMTRRPYGDDAADVIFGAMTAAAQPRRAGKRYWIETPMGRADSVDLISDSSALSNITYGVIRHQKSTILFILEAPRAEWTSALPTLRSIIGSLAYVKGPQKKDEVVSFVFSTSKP